MLSTAATAAWTATGSSVSEMWFDPRENCNRNIFASCLENGCKPIGIRYVVVLTDEHPKSLPNRSNVCLVIALRPEVLCEGEGILRGEQAFVPLVDRESDHRQVVKRVHSKPV